MKTSQEILDRFEKASTGLLYGSVCLTLSIKQGKSRYVITREESYIPESEQSEQDKFTLKSEEVA